MTALPLSGYRVLELAHLIAGPVCGMYLADMGADVVKIEHPAGGDASRLVYGTPPHHAWLWWSQGWLFVFATEDNSIDLESFQRAYLTRVQAPPLSPIEEL